MWASGQVREWIIHSPQLCTALPMNDRNLVRGLYLMAISLTFGLTSLRYPIGDLARAGPGLFPLMMSVMLLLVAIATIVRSRFARPLPLTFQYKNIAIILGSLVGLSIVSQLVNMAAGIVFMVFFSGLAGSAGYSWVRNVKISIGLLLVAFAFHKLLGLQLPLY